MPRGVWRGALVAWGSAGRAEVESSAWETLWASSIRLTEAGVGVAGGGGAAAGIDRVFFARFAGGVVGGTIEPFV